MKITIKYAYEINYYSPFVASTEINGRYMCALSGEGYDDAKTKLLKQIEDQNNAKPPQPEEIEI